MLHFNSGTLFISLYRTPHGLSVGTGIKEIYKTDATIVCFLEEHCQASRVKQTIFGNFRRFWYENIWAHAQLSAGTPSTKEARSCRLHWAAVIYIALSQSPFYAYCGSSFCPQVCSETLPPSPFWCCIVSSWKYLNPISSPTGWHQTLFLKLWTGTQIFPSTCSWRLLSLWARGGGRRWERGMANHKHVHR